MYLTSNNIQVYDSDQNVMYLVQNVYITVLHLKKTNTIYIFHDLNFGKLRGTRMVGNVVFFVGEKGNGKDSLQYKIFYL
jgi:hypothetical protein